MLGRETAKAVQLTCIDPTWVTSASTIPPAPYASHITHYTSRVTHHTLVDFSFRNSRLSRLHSSRAVTNMLYLRLIASSMYQYNSRLLPSFPLGRSCRKLNSNGSYYLQF